MCVKQYKNVYVNSNSCTKNICTKNRLSQKLLSQQRDFAQVTRYPNCRKELEAILHLKFLNLKSRENTRDEVLYGFFFFFF